MDSRRKIAPRSKTESTENTIATKQPCIYKPSMARYVRRGSSGSLAMFAAIRASSRVSSPAAKRARSKREPLPFSRNSYLATQRDKLIPYMRAAELVHMFNATLIVVEAFIRELRTMYERTYGTMEPGYPGVISFVAQLALENIATSDAAYHDVDHTIMVTLVGQEILRGRHISVGGVTPHDWLHFIISLLCHDIGYVREICRGDGDGSYVTNLAGDNVTVSEGATDASLTPYHVARSKLFVRERFAKALVHLDIAAIEANIEHTRFPVPEDEQHESTDDFPGLVRAADLIGQLADINYLRKLPALFNEFRETGMSNKLKYNSVADLRANYPDFFWKTVRPYIGDALRYLRVTQEGQQWIANLYANVFSMEHRGQLFRPSRFVARGR